MDQSLDLGSPGLNESLGVNWTDMPGTDWVTSPETWQLDQDVIMLPNQQSPTLGIESVNCTMLTSINYTLENTFQATPCTEPSNGSKISLQALSPDSETFDKRSDELGEEKVLQQQTIASEVPRSAGNSLEVSERHLQDLLGSNVFVDFLRNEAESGLQNSESNNNSTMPAINLLFPQENEGTESERLSLQASQSFNQITNGSDPFTSVVPSGMPAANNTFSEGNFQPFFKMEPPSPASSCSLQGDVTASAPVATHTTNRRGRKRKNGTPEDEIQREMEKRKAKLQNAEDCDPEKVQKKEKRKQQNRTAANRCRIKKKVEQQSMAEQHQHYSDHNRELEKEMEMLNRQKDEFTRILSEHNSHCQILNLR